MIGSELDGRLEDGQLVQLERHLDGCAECREYRADLVLGRRLLRATEPQPADNFNWKLQLRMNRVLQERAAESQPIWGNAGNGVLGWVRSFALSSLAGAAVVAALFIWVIPVPFGGDGPADMPSRPAVRLAGGATSTANDAAAGFGLDRRPLTPLRGINGSGMGSFMVNAGSRGRESTRLFDGQPFRPNSGVDSELLERLRVENAFLRARLGSESREVERLKALLESKGIDLLDDVNSRE